MNSNKWRLMRFTSHQYLIRDVCLVVLIFITAVLFINLVLNGIFYFVLSIVFALIVLLLGVLILKWCFPELANKRWLIFTSLLISIAVFFIAPKLFFKDVQQMVNYANFYPMRDGYLKRIEMLDRTNEPLFVAFEWKNISSKELLIYDESNELDDPKRVMSKSWWKRAQEKETEFSSCLWWKVKVANNFFLVTFYCDQPYSGGAIPQP